MPPLSSRMTKQPERPARFFPGKALAADPVSEDDDSDEDDELVQEKPKAPPPKVTSFPAKSKSAIDVTQAKARSSAAAPKPDDDDLEGFVTASESSEDEAPPATAKRDGGVEGDDDEDEEEEEESSSEDEESSSDDEPKKLMLAPRFIPKSQRGNTTQPQARPPDADQEAQHRAEKTDALLQAQLERDAAARAAGRRAWDDDQDAGAEDDVSDTDGADPEAERAAWKLRELRRVQRERNALIAKEREREEVERRRNLSAEERAREDAEHLAKQEAEQEGKGKMAYMQKYFHRGAFFRGDAEGDQGEVDEEVRAALERDVAGRRFEDEAGDKSVLPEYMRIRDMTRLGRKGRTKYKDMRSEDTGRWGELPGKKREYNGLDERFRPDDRGSGGRDRTGANAAPVGERRRREEDDGRERGDKRARYD